MRPRPGGGWLFWPAAAALLLLAARLRGPEYDEAYSIFLTAGHARPAWPQGVFTAGSVRWFYDGHASFWRIAQNLRRGMCTRRSISGRWNYGGARRGWVGSRPGCFR